MCGCVCVLTMCGDDMNTTGGVALVCGCVSGCLFLAVIVVCFALCCVCVVCVVVFPVVFVLMFGLCSFRARVV